MRYEDRNSPSGKVWKWYGENWSEPEPGGHLTPIFPARTDYHQKVGEMYWGPTVHWNTYQGFRAWNHLSKVGRKARVMRQAHLPPTLGTAGLLEGSSPEKKETSGRKAKQTPCIILIKQP